MVGDAKLSVGITVRGWGGSITNIVTRHDIVPRILLAAWEGGKIVGLAALLSAVKSLLPGDQLRQPLPAQEHADTARLIRRVCLPV